MNTPYRHSARAGRLGEAVLDRLAGLVERHAEQVLSALPDRQLRDIGFERLELPHLPAMAPAAARLRPLRRE